MCYLYNNYIHEVIILNYQERKLAINNDMSIDQIDDDSCLVFDKNEKMYHILNATALMILKNCEHKNLDKLVEMFREKYDLSDVSDAELKKDISAILEDLITKRIVLIK